LLRPELCSPKSVYALARLYDLPEAALAAKAIEERLKPRNVLIELLSRYSSRHDEISELEMDYLVAHWGEVLAAVDVEVLEENGGCSPRLRACLFKLLQPTDDRKRQRDAPA